MQGISGRERLQVVRHRTRAGFDDRVLRRAAERGALVRLRSGAYVPTEVWAGLGVEDRMRLEAAAAFEVGRTSFIGSHDTAAALWQVPRIRRPDGLVHMRVTRAAGTRTENGMRKHAVADVDLHVVAVHGVPCTSLERTIVDLALTASFGEAVVAADRALRVHTSREALHRVLEEVDPIRGRRRALHVLDFADPRSESPGESLSRAQMAEQGLVIPELQTRFDDAVGLIGFVDFFWPELGLIGESDGLQKYSDPALPAGRTPAEAVIAEKRREAQDK